MSYLKQLKKILASIDQHPLAGRHKLNAYYNFFFWQLRCRINKSAIKVMFTDRTFLMAKKGMEGATGNIYTGLHEFNDMGFLLHFLKPEDLFLDIGANIGSYTVLASGHIGASSITFEPIPSTFNSLKKNIEVNQLQNKVKALQVGVGSENTELTFTTNLDSVNHVSLGKKTESAANTVQVKVVKIDEVLKQERFPSMIKIDVEGFETEVLNGMPATLNNESLKAILIELNGCGKRYGYDEEKIHELLLLNGFSACSYDPFTRNIILLETYGEFNTLYLRDLDFIKERICNAEKITMFSESF